jgi:hypothetical protein
MNLTKQPKLHNEVYTQAGPDFGKHSAMPDRSQELSARLPGTASTKPVLELTVDEMVLTGFPPRDRFLIADAMERELSALLAARGIPGLEGEPLSVEGLDAGKFKVRPGVRPNVIGRQVAQAVYRQLLLQSSVAPQENRD